MGIRDLFKRPAPETAPKKRKTPYLAPRRRGFSGAKIDRLTADWTATPKPINADIKRGLRILRARTRDQAQNNDHVRGFLRLLKSNVIGSQGITLQSRVQNRNNEGLDKLACDAIEADFTAWGKRGNADVTGRLSWKMIQNLYVETMARDGEVLIQFHPGFNNNRWRFALEFIDVELLDVTHNVTMKNGNEVVMGVELNKYKRPVAYHLLSTHSAGSEHYQHNGRNYQRIPASRILHDFMVEWVDQVRGVPWVASGLQRLNMLNGYEEAELVAARTGSSKMGFFETDPEFYAEYVGDEVDDYGDTITDAEPGTFERLPAGMKFVAWDPQHPNAAFADFVKATLRGISSGLGVSYNSLANDLEGVNYSSLRQGALEERSAWMNLQSFVIESLCERVFAMWLPNALLAGISLPNGGTLRADDLDRYIKSSWQGRRWPWVDPQKEMVAHREAYDLKIRSRSEIIREQGRDPEDVWQEIAAENKRMEDLGLNPNPPHQENTQTQNQEDNDDAD